MQLIILFRFNLLYSSTVLKKCQHVLTYVLYVLYRGMLAFEPLQRMSAFEASLHPFLTSGSSDPMTGVAPDITQNTTTSGDIHVVDGTSMSASTSREEDSTSLLVLTQTTPDDINERNRKKKTSSGKRNINTYPRLR